MKNLIGYVHFIGFVPAIFTFVEANPDKELTWVPVMMSAVFSWGFVISGILDKLN